MLTSQLWSESNHNSRNTTLWLEPIARVIKCTKKWSAPSDQMANFVHPETLWSRIDHIDQIRILHDDRWGKGSVHHVDYIWLASTRLGAGAMKQVEIVVIVMLVKTLPAICIFWRSGGAGYPGWEVARLLVLVLRLLKTMFSYFHNRKGSRPKKGPFSVRLKQIKIVMRRTHLWRNSGEAGSSSTPPAKSISIWTTRQQWAH